MGKVKVKSTFKAERKCKVLGRHKTSRRWEVRRTCNVKGKVKAEGRYKAKSKYIVEKRHFLSAPDIHVTSVFLLISFSLKLELPRTSMPGEERHCRVAHARLLK